MGDLVARLPLAAGQMAGDKIACPTGFFSGAVFAIRRDVKMRRGVILFHAGSEHASRFPKLESGP
ncbi:MAG TPA: hypothetical protein VGG72_09570 [Bryobacteraceae bacterium]